MPTASVRPTSSAEGYGPPAHSAWQDIDWRRHQRWEVVEGRAINLIDIGDGPPLVFIHGLGGSWQNWLENIPHFARTHRVIALDLPGFGASEMPREDISIEGYARIVETLLQQVGIEQATVVGNSMGGFIGAEMTVHFPVRVDRLVLVSAAGLHREQVASDPFVRSARYTKILLTWGTLQAQQRELVRRPRLRQAMLWMVAAHPEKLPATLCLEQLKGAGKPGFYPALDALKDYELGEGLREIQARTLIIWGDKDRLVPVRYADEFERRIPGSRKVIFEDTGHVPMFERPVRFNREVEQFLAEAGPGAAAQDADSRDRDAGRSAAADEAAA
jgi:pimeloyl-ACP methyl ester carboxylesterase